MRARALGGLVLALLAGCRGKPTQKIDAGAQSAPLGAPSAAPLGMLGAVLAGRADEPGPYDEPRESPGFKKDADHYAILELDGQVVELKSLSLFGKGGVELRGLTAKLAELARTPSVKGLLLRLDDVDLDLAAAEEVAAALTGFRSAGAGHRPVRCYAESATNVVYYLMSACDSIGLAPGGEVMISGAAATPIHLKGTLDRLGVQADFVHVGAFKGAAEPLTRDSPSPEMMETLNAILDQRYATLVDGIAAGRHLPPARVRELIDTAVFTAEDALAAHLVDQVAMYDAFRDQGLGGAPWTLTKLDDDDSGAAMGKLMELLGVAPHKRPGGPHVALVYAVGNVVDGKGDGAMAARRQIAPRPLGAALRTLAADDDVKAVVIRVDSGGGSALASELLWQTVAALKKKKPVVVSMGDMAASGGYYISCGASRVFADRNTLTGSIGVVGGKLAIGGGLAKLGIAAFPVGRGKRSLMWSALGPWRPDERDAVLRMMQGVYKVFVGRVAEGRGKSRDQVEALAQGRVWTGAAARERGLVNQIGGLDAALTAAYLDAKLDRDKSELEIYPPPPTLLDFLGSFGVGSFGVSALPLGLGAAAREVAATLGPREAAEVAALMQQLAAFQGGSVQAATLFPVVFR